ncbi:protein DYAD [Cannabis sativa]|uniref:protein DYAD n=1 Tax=Cannabis sativa TaxID=3483 RepID=UPI0029C9FD72|nr:protein DYAD [Cannabis sativa]
MAEFENEEVEEGYFYQISHENLPPQSPDKLYSVLIVMVFKKNERNVSLRFPSIYSLSEYFGDESYRNTDNRKVPVLDERHDMSLEIAASVLRRRILPDEFELRRKFSSFWAPVERSFRQGNGADRGSGDVAGGSSNNKVVCSKSSCLSLLKCTGLVQWGSRRQVRYIGRGKPVEKEKKVIVEEARDGEEDEGKEEEEDEDYKDVKAVNLCNQLAKTRSATKRKISTGEEFKRSREIEKKPKCLKKKNQTVLHSRNKTKTLKNSIDRWSEARYKLAEQNMLKIMKAKGAVIGNPILRPDLRAEARKLIGDTGLLDHLLKHMAGKLAPGGNERFRRRHNSDGAMEYWLESAELADIRKKAGVTDSYWTPPSGWKLGDNPTQDPVCAREIKAIKEEIVNMKMDMKEVISSRDRQESMSRDMKELWKVIDKMKKVTEQGLKNSEDSDLTTVTNLVGHVDYFLIPKETFMDLVSKNTNIEKELIEIWGSLSNIEEQLMMTKNGVRVSSESEIWDANKEKLGERRVSDQGRDNEQAAMAGETKAAKIARLKSGFRICKPQGTFFWPNTTTTSSGPFVVQTPSSASSSTFSPVPHLLLVPLSPSGPQSTPPVKPVPVRGAPLSFISEGLPLYSPDLKAPSSSSVINLNEVPVEENIITCGREQ